VREVNYRDQRQLEWYRSRSSGRRGRYQNSREDRGRWEDRERREEYRRKRMPPAREERRQPAIPEIHTIVGEFTGGGESNWARKAYAWQAGGAHEVYAIGRHMKQTKKDLMIIGFSNMKTLRGYYSPHRRPGGHADHRKPQRHRILVDNESSTDILYWSAFKKLNLE
jgi:hypothetical protein